MCRKLGVSRSLVYYKKRREIKVELAKINIIVSRGNEFKNKIIDELIDTFKIT